MWMNVLSSGHHGVSQEPTILAPRGAGKLLVRTRSVY